MSRPIEVKNLSASEVRDAADGGRCLVIDVREPQEFAAERIPGAFNLPLSAFDPSMLRALDPEQVVLQCGSGMRSAKALEACQAAGYPATRHLAGGIGSWKAAGLATIQINPATGRPV